MILCVIVLFYRPAEVHGRKQRKDISLQQRHEQLQEVHKGRECHAKRPHGHTSKDKDQTEQRQDDNVPRRNVGKKTNHQGEWLCQDTD